MKLLLFILPVLIASTLSVNSQDTLKYSLSLNYSKDMSDTFGGGSILCSDFLISKTWYGGGLIFGLFQSHKAMNYQISLEDSQTFDIPFDELATMQIGSVYGIMTPIQKGPFKIDILLGAALGKSKNLCFRSISYTYNTNDKILTSVEKDYYFIDKTHIGYHTGINVSFNFFKGIGVQLTSRLFDLSNGGTFFFVGGGLIFNI